MKTTHPTEHQEQCKLCDWLNRRGIPHFAVPNGARLGGRNRARQMVRLKAEGLLPGAPDLVIIRQSGTAPCWVPIAIELKKIGGDKPKPHQLAVHEIMRANGWIVIVAYGAADAIKQLESLEL